MSNRWKMNRMGLINFWLYDEEIFHFADGKLLLRGQNGSGKSITTQSFIPFILDGDRTPSRLDPFGSSDRKMEYYFLGEEDRDEATGYLFLEFKKEDTDQYRTIGIGQRAKRGAPMGFWGFVLTDGRRIGYDLPLYKEVGNTKIPHSKQDLKKLLGPDTPFTDMPGEYKSLVNKYIFGFPRMEQYDQFIRLLVKVRAPKLSKEFKPTKVYDILNESLQTLTDEDLRAMVDAMEKMDTIQNSLEHLREAYGDVRKIQTEYTRYNQFMLAHKAKAYLDEKALVEKSQNKLDADIRMLHDLEEEKSAGEKEQLEKKHRQSAIEVELEALRETDLDAIVRKLEADRRKEAELKLQEERWQREADQIKVNLLESDRKIREYEDLADSFREELKERREELEEYQETLQFPGHEAGMRMLGDEESCLMAGDRSVSRIAGQEKSGGTRQFQTAVKDLESQLRERIGEIRAGKQALQAQEEVEKRYDLAAQEAANALAVKQEREAELEQLSQEEENARDSWIEGFYQLSKRNQELVLNREELAALEQDISAYQGSSEASRIRKILEECRENSRKALREKQECAEKQEREARELLGGKMEELERLQKITDWEPERKAAVIASRKMLNEAGIPAVPFYQAVEFSAEMDQEERDLLETQLRDAGLLDALVVERKNWGRIRAEFPEFSDVMIAVTEEDGRAPFSKLTVNEELPEELKVETLRILRNIAEESSDGSGLTLHADGFFSNGILKGRSRAEGAAVFIGALERRRRLEQEIRGLREEISELEERLEALEEEQEELAGRLVRLDKEYAEAPDSTELDQILEKKKQCLWYLAREQQELEKAEKAERNLAEEKNRCMQKVIQICKNLPYLRTCADYQEAEDAGEDYANAWKQAFSELRSLGQQLELQESEREKQEQNEEHLDIALGECAQKRRERDLLAIAMREAEEYLNRPENREIARRLEALTQETVEIRQQMEKIGNRLAVIQSDFERISKELEQEKQELTDKIVLETKLRQYFEEELSLKLVLERGEKNLSQCAKEAMQQLRESDRNRNASELTTSLYRLFQQHNSSLVRYGTALEDCFAEEDTALLRKRQRITSIWNGKKLYFAEFCQMLKNSIEETELLIQQKDRELFEDILSRTLSQQLTERIGESREWIKQMSSLMKGMDTSMGLSFSLEWKAKSAESDQELDTLELEKLLMRDRKLLTMEDVERVAMHFRSKIRAEKQRVEENNGVVNYLDLVRDALDYRKWFEFQMYYYRNQESRKPLTNAAFNKFSGGEKAMAMYVPLFAAVNAQYQKCGKKDFPRMMALDEAFAGVDEKNISSMFQLVETLDFDYIMNSQAIWGCYETVPSLKISELYRPLDAQMVTVIHYTWNGHERELDEQ